MILRVVVEVEAEFVDRHPIPEQRANVARHAESVAQAALNGMSLRALRGWRVTAVDATWADEAAAR